MIVKANDYDTYFNSLEHYGVQGMKWGVRRAQKKSAQAYADQRKKEYASVSKNIRAQTKAKVSSKKSEYKEAKKSGDKAQTKIKRLDMTLAKLYGNKNQIDADLAYIDRYTNHDRNIMKVMGTLAYGAIPGIYMTNLYTTAEGNAKRSVANQKQITKVETKQNDILYKQAGLRTSKEYARDQRKKRN